jgi:hypothetical protein
MSPDLDTNVKMQAQGKVDVRNYFRVESALTTTGAGPLAASLAFALTANLAIPSGYSLLFVSLILASCVPFIHRNTNWLRKSAMFVAGALLIFAQGASTSTLMSHQASDLKDHAMCHGIGVGDIIIPNAVAEVTMPEEVKYVVDEDDGNYIVTTPDKVHTVPKAVFEAIVDYQLERRKETRKQSLWKVRFK